MFNLNGKYEILVVDDEVNISVFIKELLERDPNIEVTLVESGKEAIELYRDRHFPLVITDYKMPGMNGIELMQEIQKMYPPCQVILTTGFEDKSIIVEGLQNGVCDFITKPYDRLRLEMAVKKGIEKHQLIFQNIQYQENLEALVAEKTEKLDVVLFETIRALNTIIEDKDPFTANHQARTACLAIYIAETMGCSRNDIVGLRIAGYLHDIGKIYVPTEFLSKPGKLSKNEFQLIKDHSTKSYNILKKIPFDYNVAEIAWHHHEKMDGSGYPQGLTEKDIQPMALILTVADIFEAMVSHRPYRKALSVETALNELRNGAGVLFSSEVVDALLHIITKFEASHVDASIDMFLDELVDSKQLSKATMQYSL